MVPLEARELVSSLNKKRVIDWLVAPDGRFGDDPIAGRNELLRRSFSEGVDELVERLGPDTAAWRYGQEKFKHVLIRHPLSPAVDDDTRALLDVGPAPRGGYDSTLNATRSGDNQTGGASFRVILDAANWDNSIATNSPGQSGDPMSPHYRDLFDLWVHHQYFPLFYTRAKINSVTEHRLVLEPTDATDR
jgi:penicillin amidase